MKNRIVIILIIAFSAVLKVNAQEALTLEESIAIALENNLNIKVTKFDADISKNRATKGNAGLLPSVDLGANSNYTEYANDEFSSSANIGLSYTIFNGFSGRYSYKLLNIEKAQSELQTQYNIELIITDVISGFYDLNEKYDDLAVAEDNLDISIDRLKRNRAKYEFGKINKLEVLNARVDFNRDSSSYLRAKQVYDQAGRELNVLLGRSAEIPFTIVPDASSFRNFDLDELKKETLVNNADYLLARSQIEADELNEKQAKAKQLPSLKLNTAYNYYENTILGTNSNTQLTGGLSLSMNLFDGKKKKINIVNAKIQKQISLNQEAEKRLQVEKELVNAYASHQYNLQILSLEEDALDASKLNFEESREYYQLGQITSTTYREAQLNYVEAQNQRSAARYDAKLSELSIERISGTLLKKVLK